MATATTITAADVVIVILNWKQAGLTTECLASLARAQLDGARTLVVDNGSGDGSAQAIRRSFPEQDILELPVNAGYAGGNNAGIRHALKQSAGAILLLNNDTRVSPDFLIPLLWAINSAADVAAVSSAIHRQDQPEVLQWAYSEVRFAERDVVKIRGVNKPPWQGFDTLREIEVAPGCSLLLSSEALRSVGLLDEEYFAYHEDVDWCLRARRSGYRILFEPLSRVFHHGSGSTASRTRPPAPATLPDSPDLPSAEPPSWNPVRAYLGSRNLIRLQRAYATPRQRILFTFACLHELPLEFLAAVLDREGWVTLGRWTYAEAFRAYFLERRPVLRRPSTGRLKKLYLLALLFPVDLLWCLPRDILRACRAGRTAQVGETLRGLLDGLTGRPIPYTRLGLRPPGS